MRRLLSLCFTLAVWALMTLVSVVLSPQAVAAPALQLPWPQGETHRISDGYTYDCGDHLNIDYYAIDFQFADGDTVNAVAAGTISVMAFDPTGYGIYLVISHVGGYTSLYGHLEGYEAGLAVGSYVDAGEAVASADHTGHQYGPHLHFRMTKDGAAYKPEPMSGITGFGSWGSSTTNPPCGTPYSPYWPSIPSNADVTSFYDYGSGAARLHTWLSTGSALAYQGAAGWWQTSRGYALSNVAGRMTQGDFNGDGASDVAVMYDYGAGAARIHMWLSTRSSYTYQGSSGWWFAPSGYGASNVGNRFVSGDFNGDGKDDIAAMYDNGGGLTTIHTWISTGSGFTYSGSGGWWQSIGYAPGQVAGRFVAGDFNYDGKTDVAALYDYGSGEAHMHVWLSTGSSFTYQGSAGWWQRTGYSLSQVADRMVAGNFGQPSSTSEGRDDVATAYDYGGGSTSIHVWISTGSSFSYQGAWWTGYEPAANVGNRMVAGKEATGPDIISMLSANSSGSATLDVWRSDLTQFTYDGFWWYTSSGYDLNQVGDRFVMRDINDP